MRYARKFIYCLLWCLVSLTCSAVVGDDCIDASTTLQQLHPEGNLFSDEFGGAKNRVIIEGDFIAVGDFAADNFTGRVYTYKHDGQQWQHFQTLQPNNYAWFGRVIDYDGNTLVVSAEVENMPGTIHDEMEGVCMCLSTTEKTSKK